MLAGATVKKGAQIVIGLLAGVGFTPEDAPLVFAILVGLVTGTLAAWPKDRRRRKDLQITMGNWIAERLMLWGGVFVLVLAFTTLTGAHARVAGAVTFFMIYGGNEIIEICARRFRKWLDKEEA